jgi:hypothetical protein
MSWRRVAALMLCMTLAAASAAAAPRRKDPAPPEQGGRGKPFAQIVKDHEKLEGILTLYRGPEHLYAEIPQDLFGRPLGLTGMLVNALGDWSIRGSGIETQVVSFARVGEKVLLAKKNLAYRADSGSPFRHAVETSFPDSPVFLAEAIPTSETRTQTLVDLLPLFSPDLIEILPERSGYSASPDDATLAQVRVHRDNLVVRVVYRFRRSERPRAGGGEEEGGGPGAGREISPRLPDPRFVEVTVDYNLYRLPEDGFRARPADERIGGFETPYKDYTDVERRDSAFRYRLARWKVEKSDASAPVSPAREPITFFIDRATPPEWRPHVREAALWWNASFEKIGIRDAIRVLDQPDDPGWDPTDLHHSMIYWNLSDDLLFSGLAGPMVSDPRTGQVLKGNVYLNGEFPSFTRNRYLVYAWWRAPQEPLGADPFRLPAAPLVSRATQAKGLQGTLRFPYGCDRGASFSSQIAFARLALQARGVLGRKPAETDRFAREAFAELVAHEVGHALGFSHNFKASLSLPAADLNAGRGTGDPGSRPFAASVMDYNPVHLSPPGMPQGDYFLHGVGPYDDLLVEYIYRPFPSLSPEEEARELDRIARRAETTPGLMYDDGPLSALDPTSNTDDLGDDPLRFAEERLRVIQEEVLPRIGELVLAESHDFNLIRQALDAAIFSVTLDYVDIAARNVGGQTALRVVARGDGTLPAHPITPVDPETQRRALSLLERRIFDPGAFRSTPELLSLLKADLLFDWNYPYRFGSDYSFESRVAYVYDAALATLLQPRRLARILDNERRGRAGQKPFTIPELFGSLSGIAFDGPERIGTERAGATSIPARRRTLQRLLVGRLTGLVVEPGKGTPPESVQVARDALRQIRAQIRRVTAAPQRVGSLDGYSRAHLHDLEAGIDRVLDAKIELPRKG